jgi:diacylglycerol O-acyltransferase / wax synthase
MAQQHLDRLTAVDASFLHQEGPTSHMHVGALTVLEGPPPTIDDFIDMIRGRLHLVPRYRQRLADTGTPLDSGRPVWADDPTFNIEYHVRHTALPVPGGREQLLRLVSRIFSQQLDRSKPLWEIWLVEGLERNAFALISKNHHSLIDGIAGVDIATVLFDMTPVPGEVEHSGVAWQPHPEPSTTSLLAASLRGALRGGLELTTRAVNAIAHPDRAIERAREAVEGVGEVVWAGLNPAPATPLNAEIGPHRRYCIVDGSLSDYKLIKDTFGGTVNDVVLAVVTGALRRFLISRGVRTEGLELRALVPVSIRADTERGTMGNRIAAMRGPLPVYIEDPVARLHAVSEAMEGLKKSKQAVGAEVLAGVQNFAPPTVLAQASRLNFSTRLFNLIVTNVPGPQFPLYILGREMQELYPIAFLPRQHALSVAIMSYNGHINFGLLGDFDSLPDIDAIADWIDNELEQLVELAGGRSGDGGRGAATAERAATHSSNGAPERERALEP